MFKVTPIGSCRITTPLRQGQSSHGIHLNLARCYGYCHSPAEAVQLARFMQGDLSIPREAWPLVSRSHQLDVISRQQHSASDLYVIELASAKELTFDGVSIQLNYLNSTYKDFFADAERTIQFWAHAEQGDDAAISEFLGQQWSATQEQRAQAEVLGRVRLKYVTRESLRNDIEELTRILPDVLFVSHVDACKPDGSKISSRSDFIRLVRDEVELAGHSFYNPTDLMLEFGQSVAIEDDSTSLAHFTPEFSTAVLDEWMCNFVAPRTDNAVRQVAQDALERKLKPQIAAACQHGRFVDARMRLDALSNKISCVKPLQQYVVELQDTAHRDFIENARIAAEGNPDSETTIQFVETAAALGLFEVALDVATQTPGGLNALPTQTLIKIGLKAADAGDTDNAFEFILAAYCQNNDLPRPSRMLADLAIKGDVDVLSQLQPDQWDGIMSHLTPIQRLCLVQLNGASPAAAISRRTSAQEVADIAMHLAEHNGIEQAADLVAVWRGYQQADRIRDAGLLAMLDQWVEAAVAQSNPIDRIRSLAAIRMADPRHAGLRNGIRDARVDLVHRIRASGKAKDAAALDALETEASALPAPLPEFDLWRARLRFECGDFEEAVEFGRSAAMHMPETINIWVLLMRAAVKLKNAGMASEFARQVVDLACANTEKLKAEAEAVLHTHAHAVEA